MVTILEFSFLKIDNFNNLHSVDLDHIKNKKQKLLTNYLYLLQTFKSNIFGYN